MTKEYANRIIVSFCIKPDLLGSIVIREQSGMESYELIIDRQVLAVIHNKSAESDLGIPDRLIASIEQWHV